MKKYIQNLLVLFLVLPPLASAGNLKFNDIVNLKVGAFCYPGNDFLEIVYRVENTSSSDLIRFSSNQVNLSNKMPPIFSIYEEGKSKSDMLGYVGSMSLEIPLDENVNSGYHLYPNEVIYIKYPISIYYNINRMKNYIVESPLVLHMHNLNVDVTAILEYKLSNSSCSKESKIDWLSYDVTSEWAFDRKKQEG